MSSHLPIKATAQSPVSIHEEVDGCKQKHHGHRIVKETKHKDGVDPIRGTTHEEEHVGRDLENFKRWAKYSAHKKKTCSFLTNSCTFYI